MLEKARQAERLDRRAADRVVEAENGPGVPAEHGPLRQRDVLRPFDRHRRRHRDICHGKCGEESEKGDRAFHRSRSPVGAEVVGKPCQRMQSTWPPGECPAAVNQTLGDAVGSKIFQKDA